MALDPTYTYFLVGKATAQELTLAQAEALPGMQSVFTCTDFSGYSGPPDWELPIYWQSPESYYGLSLLCEPAGFYGETGPTQYDMAGMQVVTRYTAPDGSWTNDLSAGPDNLTGRFLVGVKGPSQALFVAQTNGDGSAPEPLTGPSVVYAYSNTDGGQYISVVTPAAPYFEAQVDSVIMLAAYDGEVPEPPPSFWTRFVNAREVV